VEDLFAQMRFLSPDILGYKSFYSFANNHLEYSDKFPGMIVRAHNTGYLAAKIAPYTYQVTKKECLDLPPKLHSFRYCEMTPRQRELYETAKDEILLDLDPKTFDGAVIFRLFTALQQITCGFWNRYPAPWWKRRKLGEKPELITVPHRRLETLDLALQQIDPGEKVVIWAKYRRCVLEIADHIRSEYDEDPALFWGDLSENKRNEQLHRFRADTRFLIATPSCGSHGLTLTEASCALYYTSGFRYSEQIQSEDRLHRIGQAKPVTYAALVCANSIDTRIQEALARKANLLHEFRGRVESVRDHTSKKKAIEQMVKEL
jgi:SNF2 family DNA or RNA helicase